MSHGIALKNVKYSSTLGHDDSHTFNATVYKNGKRWCTASDDGWGGGIDFQPLNGQTSSALYDEIKAFNATLGKVEGVEFDLDNSLDIIVGELVNDWLHLREFKKITRNKTSLQEKKDVGSNAYIQYNVKFTEEIGKKLEEKHPDCLILNTLSDEDAVKWMRGVYQAAA